MELKFSPDTPDPQSMLCCSSIELNAWHPLVTVGIGYYGLGTYQSRLVMVGGAKCHKLSWSEFGGVLLSDDGVLWQNSLPPMPTKRWNPGVVSVGQNPEYLLVAGGSSSIFGYCMLATVEVLVEGQWCSIQPLPVACVIANHCFHQGKLFLTPASTPSEMRQLYIQSFFVKWRLS